LDGELHGPERGERRGHDYFGPLVVLRLQAVGQLLDHLDGLQMAGVHLPVAHHQGLALAHDTHLSSTATPGSSRPSSSSRPAPPPVETWVTAPSSPRPRVAAAESPPPMAVKPSDSAMARATASVPERNRSHSNTPIGPLRKTDPAAVTTEANDAAATEPTSRPIQPSSIPSTPTTFESASAAKRSATTKSVGSTILPSYSPISRPTVSTMSSSIREEPTALPWALRKVKHIPP